MPAWAVLAVKIAVVLFLVVLVVGGGIWRALDRSGTAVDQSDEAGRGRVENRREIDRNADQIEENSEKINGTLRCLSRARDPQSCLQRVEGPRGPGGASGSVGQTGQRGVQGVAGRSVVGPRGRTGARGPRGLRGRPGEAARQPSNGKDGVDGVDGTPGRTGPPGPGPTDEQVQAAINSYCMVHNNCAPTVTTDSPPVAPVP